MITARDFVAQALKPDYLGIPYAKLDCQAFVERVLKDAGEPGHNWRGSNHMWREAVSERHETDFSAIPPGAWVFTLKHDGGERSKGYYDGFGNAKHVGIYLGNGEIIHSTSAGGSCVQMDVLSSPRWTAWGLCKYINYDTPSALPPAHGIATEEAENALEILAAFIRSIKDGGQHG